MSIIVLCVLYAYVNKIIVLSIIVIFIPVFTMKTKTSWAVNVIYCRLYIRMDLHYEMCHVCISERSTREKKTDYKLTGLVLLHWGELKMKHSEE